MAAIKYSLELNATVAAGGTVTIRIRACKDRVPGVFDIRLFRDGINILDATTGVDGFYVFNEVIPPTTVKQQFVYQVYLLESAENKLTTVEIPEKKINDPQKIILIKMNDSPGRYRVFIRVLKAGGYGMKTKVTIIHHSTTEELETDDRGVVIWTAPVILPGNELIIQVVVDGVEEHAKMRLKCRKIPVDRPARFSGKWFICTNNGRAFILLCLICIFWPIAIFGGIGRPLIHKNIFRNEAGYSQQENRYNSIVSQAFPTEKITISKTEVPSKWRRSIWKLAVITTLILFVYGPISMREEIGEELEKSVEKLRDRDYAQSGDPWFERMAAFTGAYSVAANKAGGTSEKKEGSVWNEFPVHLASDTITELGLAMFRSMFRK